MTWFKVDDGFYDHPKVEQVLDSEHSAVAIAIWTLSGAYCARHLTDGYVTKKKLLRLCAGMDVEAGAAVLVEAGMWRVAKDGYRFHKWTEHQPTRSEVERKRSANKARQAKFRGQKNNAVSNALRNAPVTPLVTAPRPDPTRPDPSIVKEVVQSSSGEPAGPSLRKQISELESAYSPEVVASAREGCALSRRNGKIADSVWLRTLVAMSKHHPGIASEAMTTFSERCADGEKNERYMLGIARSLAKGGSQPTLGRGGGMLPGSTDFGPIADISTIF